MTTSPPAPLPSSPPAAGAVTGTVRTWLRLEGLVVLVVAVLGYRAGSLGWGIFALLFLVPDVSFLGYVAGPRWGARTYNLAHSTVGPLALLLAGLVLGRAPALVPYAWIWLAHVGWDRFVGYGLKYPSAFGATHLGWKGRGSTVG